MMFDLEPATTQLSRLVSAVRDDQLGRPTPCTEWTVEELLVHIHQFTSVFTTNAAKLAPNPPAALVAGWREEIPRALEELTLAWRDESAWRGTVSAGGVEMQAADNAVVAAEELTVHGWDLARATGQDVTIDDARLDLIDAFFDLFGSAPFGPAVDARDGDRRADRMIARTGRDPRWSAAFP